MSTISMRVAQVETLNPLIRRFTLQPVQGGALPTFDAGAHVRVRIGTADEWRHYSLIDFSTAADAGTAAPLAYAIAVRLEDAGRGGSRFMHNLQAGDVITIEPPRNDFPLAAHGGCAVLVAGGIGVTPLASMAARCRAQGRPVRMVYAGRSSALMALLPELQTVLGDFLLLPLAVGEASALRLRPPAPAGRGARCRPRPCLAQRACALRAVHGVRRPGRRPRVRGGAIAKRPAVHGARGPDHPRMPDRPRLRPPFRLQARRMWRLRRACARRRNRPPRLRS